jgi:uncharacterized protein
MSGSTKLEVGGREKGSVALGVLVLFILVALAPPLQAVDAFRIGTGGSTGVYYPIGKAIAAGLTEAAASSVSPLHGKIAIAQNSAGSIENVRGVLGGDLEAGLVQADIAALAEQRQGGLF